MTSKDSDLLVSAFVLNGTAGSKTLNSNKV